MGSFKDKAERFLVIDHSENYSFVACQSGEEVAFFVESRKAKNVAGHGPAFCSFFPPSSRCLKQLTT